jgi:excisionase family DNA binding protein
MAYVPLRVACKMLGLHPNTVREWADDGRIHAIRTEGGQRRFDVDSYLLRGKSVTICYCRVSSPKQKEDLARQVSYMQKDYPETEVVKDIGSGSGVFSILSADRIMVASDEIKEALLKDISDRIAVWPESQEV